MEMTPDTVSDEVAPSRHTNQRRRGLTLAALSICLLSACYADYPALFAPRPAPGPAGHVTCLIHGQVLFGSELKPLRNTDICFSEGLIVSLDPNGAVDIPLGADVFDIRGSTVLPGLVDTHVHSLVTGAPPWAFRIPNAEHNLEAWLWSGITTIFDMGGTPSRIASLKTAVDDREILGPQIFFAHEPISAPDGHPIPAAKALLPWPVGDLLASTIPVIEEAGQATEIVASVQEEGAQYVKVIHDALPPGSPRMDLGRLTALVDAAHAVGLKAMVHIGSNQDALEAISAGADHLVHGVYREAISQEVITRLRTSGLTVSYTASAFDNTRLMAAGQYATSPHAMQLTDPELLRAVTGDAGAKFADLPVLGDFAHSIASTEILRENIRRLHEAGIVILIGTDSPVAAVIPGFSFHEELAFLASAGIPADILVRRATVDGAHLISDAPNFGSLAIGMRADLLVVAGDPTLDIRALLEIEYLFAAGERLNRIVAP